MKKILLLIAALSVAMLFASCKKDENKKIDDEAGPNTAAAWNEAPFVWRGVIDGLKDAWDFCEITYNENGTIKKVNRNDGERVWNWDWAGNGTREAATSGYNEIHVYRNEDGTISSLSKGSDNYVYTYTNGILTEAKKNGNVVTTITVSDGNITKVVDGENTLEFEYGNEDNVNGFMLHWLDQKISQAYPSWHRFLVEGGMFGKGPAKCPVSVKINGESYDYAYDKPVTADGYDVYGWSLPALTIPDHWDDEIHTYYQVHKDK